MTVFFQFSHKRKPNRIPKTWCVSVAYRGGFGVFNPPSEILKALQNRAKLNPIVKTVKNF